MSVYPDTSMLCAMYREQDNSRRADEWMDVCLDSLPVSTLLLLEFRQSVRFQMRLFGKDHSKGFSKNEGAAVLRLLQSDLTNGVLTMISPDWADVHRIAEDLSSKYTETEGHRFADILHVATAIHLSADQFFTFDVNQKRLAEAEGMIVPD